MNAQTVAQRSAVASLIGRCEGLISNREIPAYQAARLLELLNQTCAAFDMTLPQLENDEKESAI
jgi:hypothetical protein